MKDSFVGGIFFSAGYFFPLYRSITNLCVNSEIFFTQYLCCPGRREHAEIPHNYSENPVIFVLIVLLLSELLSMQRIFTFYQGEDDLFLHK